MRGELQNQLLVHHRGREVQPFPAFPTGPQRRFIKSPKRHLIIREGGNKLN